MAGLQRNDLRWLGIRIGIIAVIVIVCILVVSIGMKTVNSSLGLETPEETASDSVEIYYSSDSLYTAEQLVLPEPEDIPEGPEASWEVTPCSIYTSESSAPVIDSLPLAPSVEFKPMEATYLVRRCAQEIGMEEDELQKVYVFNDLDTIYVDLPREADLQGLKLTIESRFICFTRLFPLLAGNLMSSYPDGIGIRGIEGVFRQ